MKPSLHSSVAEHRGRPLLRTGGQATRAAVAVGTLVALVASLGAPFKWY